MYRLAKSYLFSKDKNTFKSIAQRNVKKENIRKQIETSTKTSNIKKKVSIFAGSGLTTNILRRLRKI